jgi:hypothetical protein
MLAAPAGSTAGRSLAGKKLGVGVQAD